MTVEELEDLLRPMPKTAMVYIGTPDDPQDYPIESLTYELGAVYIATIESDDEPADEQDDES